MRSCSRVLPCVHRARRQQNLRGCAICRTTGSRHEKGPLREGRAFSFQQLDGSGDAGSAVAGDEIRIVFEVVEDFLVVGVWGHDVG